jgi:hypothetical protein
MASTESSVTSYPTEEFTLSHSTTNFRKQRNDKYNYKPREKLENCRPKDVEITDMKEAICGVGRSKQELEESRRKKNEVKEKFGLLTTEQLQDDFDKMYYKMKEVSVYM